MHFARWTILIGFALSAAALALPYLSAPLLGNVNGIEGDAWPVLVFLAPAGLLAIVGDRAEGLRPVAAIAAILSASVALLFAVAKVADAASAADTARATGGEGSIGLGAWALVATVLVALIGCVAALSRRVR